MSAQQTSDLQTYKQSLLVDFLILTSLYFAALPTILNTIQPTLSFAQTGF